MNDPRRRFQSAVHYPDGAIHRTKGARWREVPAWGSVVGETLPLPAIAPAARLGKTMPSGRSRCVRVGTDLLHHGSGLPRSQRDDSTCLNNDALARIADESARSSGF